MSDQYGCDVSPSGPVQDMAAIDLIAGAYPSEGRTASPAGFTGGTGGGGLGGEAEPAPATKVNTPGGGPTPGNAGSPLTAGNG